MSERTQPIRFTETGRLIFHRYCGMADAVAALIGRHCEVVVHSLEDPEHSAVKVINGDVSGRSVGAPLTNLCFELMKDSEQNGTDILGPYYSVKAEAKTIRSTTAIIRGENERIIGLICFNMDLSCPFGSIMQQYRPHTPNIAEVYPQTAEELIRHMLDEAILRAGERKGASALEKNLAAIEIMIEKGLFNFKGAVDIVARELGISRASVYNYLRESRGK